MALNQMVVYLEEGGVGVKIYLPSSSEALSIE